MTNIELYMYYIFKSAKLFDKKYFYQETLEPVFRGISYNEAIIREYKPGSIGLWPMLTSTSKSLAVANAFANQSSEGEKRLLF